MSITEHQLAMASARREAQQDAVISRLMDEIRMKDEELRGLYQERDKLLDSVNHWKRLYKKARDSAKNENPG